MTYQMGYVVYTYCIHSYRSHIFDILFKVYVNESKDRLLQFVRLTFIDIFVLGHNLTEKQLF